MMGARIVKGNQDLNTFKPVMAKDTDNKPNVDEIEKVNHHNIDQQRKAQVDYIVLNTYNAAMLNKIPADKASSIIVGRIRVKFVEGIKTNPENEPVEFDIQSLRYLDDVLFSDLEYLIRSVLYFGTNGVCIKVSQCMKMIRDTANLIYYKLDQTSYNEIEGILKVVYNE